MQESWTSWLPLDTIIRLKRLNPSGDINNKEQFLSEIGMLDLSNINLARIPDFVYEMRNLEYLNLSDNYIHGDLDLSKFPSSLQSLDLSNNELSSVRGSLKSLTYLNLDKNKLTSVPKGMGGMEELLDLSMEGNLLGELVLEEPLPSSLLHIDLSYNSIRDLKVPRGYWKNCTRVYLQGNKLEEMDARVFSWSKVRAVDVRENPFIDWDFLTVLSKRGVKVEL